MSGGSMGYFYTKVEDAASSFRGGSVRRAALKRHLLKLAEVMRAVEWNDSGDGDDREDGLIDELLGPAKLVEAANERLQSAIDDAKSLQALLKVKGWIHEK